MVASRMIKSCAPEIYSKQNGYRLHVNFHIVNTQRVFIFIRKYIGNRYLSANYSHSLLTSRSIKQSFSNTSVPVTNIFSDWLSHGLLKRIM